MFGRKDKQNVGGGGNDQDQKGKRKGADLMNQMGFGGMPGLEEMDAMVYGDEDDDGDLEAELAALTGETSQLSQKAKPKRKAPMPMSDIESMVAMGLNDEYDDISDTDDADLEAELAELASDDLPSPSKSAHVVAPPPVEQRQVPAPSQIQPRQAPPSFQTPPKQAQSQQVPNFGSTVPAPAPRSSPQSQQAPVYGSPAPAPRSSPQKSPAVIPRPSPQRSTPPATQPTGLPGVLEERIAMYRKASANAKAAGDSSKQRRLDRGLKTLAGQLKMAKAGKPVIEEEIPPPVAMTSISVSSGASAETPTVNTAPRIAAPGPPTADDAPPDSAAPGGSEQTDGTKSALEERRDQYRRAALQAKHAGDLTKARELVKVAKQFDQVLDALQQGKPVDLSQMPPPPTQMPASQPPVERMTHQAAGDKEPEMELPHTTAEEEKSMFQAPEAPRTVMEALIQRRDKYKASEGQAKAEGESGKARRMGRIVKQYDDAIKSFKAGKTLDFEELPCPPGFGPIPTSSGPPAPRAPAPAPAAPSPSPTKPQQHQSPQPPVQQGASSAARAPIQRQASTRLHSRQEQQLAFLKERLGEFKHAALQAKKNHDLELAKKYVRMMKGLEPMIDACEGGLPVDLSQVPPSPVGGDDAEDKFVVVSVEDCQPTGDREVVYKGLQRDLIRQIQVCVTNAQHYTKLGDIPAAAKFQKLEQNNRKDLESLKSAFRHADPCPRFHYETRSFSMVQCNTELGDGDLELSVVRGLAYNLPSGYSEKDMDTCVKYEFAYPTDEIQSGGTGTVKDTANPEYNETFKIAMNRKSKGLFRFVERKSLKLEVYIKRGFFKGDKLLGTVNVKLQPLEGKCTLHDSYDLMDGRKSVGGKLEVKIRIRDPFKNKQVDEVKEKWLVIDQFLRTAASKSQSEAKAAPKAQSEGTMCMEVLRYEKSVLDKQINQLKDSLSVTQTQALRHKSSLIEEKIELQQKKLREGGVEAWKAYYQAVRNESSHFEQQARQFAKLGEMQKAELMVNKKKFADKESAAIKAKIPDA